MALFAVPPAPPQPPAIIRCTDAAGNVVSDCAKYVYKRQQNHVEARFTGNVQINLKSEAVVIVPAGATATVEEHAGKDARRFTAANGKTTYTVNGVEHAYDAAARKWLRDVLSTMPARPVPPEKLSR